MNIIKISQSPDTYQQHNVFSSDGIIKQWYPLDCLLTFRINLHQTMGHNSEILLKLSPYTILNIDPTLDDLNYSNALSRFLNSLGK